MKSNSLLPERPLQEAASLSGDGVSLPSTAAAAGISQQDRGLWAKVSPYFAIARPDHWFKNIFMILGAMLAAFYHPEVLSITVLPKLLAAVAVTCLLASSNYVINEILDAPTDRSHRSKRNRPIPSGLVNLRIAYAEWILLGVVGTALAFCINTGFGIVGAVLLLMGLVYNVPPVRLKDWAYLDVLCESVNNSLRLMLGWFAVSELDVPPLSLLIFYWMLGAFFMASKRYAEYRWIADKSSAGDYRTSFKFYDEQKLLVSMFFYATTAALFLGVFIIRFKLELLLSIPLIAGAFAYYLHVSMKAESAAQAPEKLYKERGLTIYLAITVVVFVGLMFVHIPKMYKWFNVEPARVPALWKIES